MLKTVVSSLIDRLLQGTVIVGANVDGRPNFTVNAWHGSLDYRPPIVGVKHSQHTHKGILQNMTFSFNLPSFDLIKEVTYCGAVSGTQIDKAEACGFKVFYGKLSTAPLIEQCPINIECSVVHTLDLGAYSLFVGKVEETWISNNFLNDDGIPDFKKVNPLYCAKVDMESQACRLYVELQSDPDNPQEMVNIAAAGMIEDSGN